VTEGDWKATMDTLNRDPATQELRVAIERACWRYLTHIRDCGIGAQLKVTIDPIAGSE
jgi:hypothetical protein